MRSRDLPIACCLLGLGSACGSSATSSGPPGIDAGYGPTPDGGTQVGPDSGTTSRDAATDADAAGSGDTGPFPLGVTWGNAALHFRVRAGPATAVELDLYAETQGADEVMRVAMTRSATGQPWAADVTHAAIAAAGIKGAVFYGYRAWGPNWPRDPAWTKGSSAGFVSDVDASGNRFDPNKLLVDPYAREISHDPLQPGSLSYTPYSTGAGSRDADDGRIAPSRSRCLPARRVPARARRAPSRTTSSTRSTSAASP